MGKEGKGLKRCSTSTDVEASDHKGTKPLEKAETELHNSETDVNSKKRKKKSEIKEMKKLRKSIQEMTETMKNLQDFFRGEADLPGITLKVQESVAETMKKLQEMLMNKAPAPAPAPSPSSSSSSKEEEPEPQEKTELLAKYECCFKTEDSDGRDSSSIFVRGINTCLARDDIKSALRKHFESGGCRVSRVFVPIECKTGVPLGHAFVDVDDNEKALQFGGGVMGGCMFLVMMAENQEETYGLRNFTGCQDCWVILAEQRQKRFLARPWSRRKYN